MHWSSNCIRISSRISRYRTIASMKSLVVHICTVVLVIAIPFTLSEKVRYDDYRVFQIRAENASVYELIQNFINSGDYQVWRYPRDFEDSSEILIPPGKFSEFSEFLESNEIDFDIIVDNVQRLIDEEQPSNIERDSFNWDSYFPLDRIYSWLDDVLRQYPNVTSSFVIGKSFEGREIRGLKISYKPNNPGVFIESNIHAREWITSATATYLINELLSSNDTEIQYLARSFDWYIIPVLNVDGFVYTHEHNRLWRKTRQQYPNVTCIGVDPNRNFDTFWLANGGASRQPCSETYAGPKPFSEPETLALANFYKSVKSNITLYLAFHSYGQYILSPYGHTNKEYPRNYKDLVAIAKDAAESIENLYGTTYTHGSTASVLYIASGSSADWAFNEGGAPLAYTYEFRDRGSYGFILPADQIIPNGEEALRGIAAMLGTAKSLSYYK